MIIQYTNHRLFCIKIEWMTLQVLNMCKAPPSEYICVFTGGATAALRMVGELFHWSTDSQYHYTLDNHNSTLGIRE